MKSVEKEFLILVFECDQGKWSQFVIWFSKILSARSVDLIYPSGFSLRERERSSVLALVMVDLSDKVSDHHLYLLPFLFLIFPHLNLISMQETLIFFSSWAVNLVIKIWFLFFPLSWKKTKKKTWSGFDLIFFFIIFN